MPKETQDTPLPLRLADLDPKTVDSQYKPFPSFADWTGKQVNKDLWTRALDRLPKDADETRLRNARDVVKRAAAVDTGAIEGLYEVDAGFTFTVAAQQFEWQAAVEAKGADFKALFSAQLTAYEKVVDFATGAVPLAEAWVRGLHEIICEPQVDYWVQTQVGPQLQKLPKGVYKTHPNHVFTRRGTIHAYCPVDLTTAEMKRLIDELAGDEFLKAHPVVQAAYAHYAFVLVHPFADGNGRMARALASIYTCRAYSMPLLVFAQMKDAYLASLERADAGGHQAFTDFIFDRAVDGILWQREALNASTAPSLGELGTKIEELYLTKSGYSHEQVDKAAATLADVLYDVLQTEVAALKDFKHVLPQEMVRPGPKQKGFLPGYRPPLKGPIGFRLVLATMKPAAASRELNLSVSVPVDPAGDDEIVATVAQTGQTFFARLNELGPPTESVRLRARMFIQGLTRQLTQELFNDASAQLQRYGTTPTVQD